MKDFLRDKYDITLVFLTTIAVLFAYTISKDVIILNLLVFLAGGLLGIAKGDKKLEQQTNVEDVNTLNVTSEKK